MNKLTLFLMTAAAAVACTSVSDKTTLQGKFTGAEAPEEVSIVIPDVIDTTVALKNGSFKIEVPAAKNVFGRIMAGNAMTNFISDGTVLTFSLVGGELSGASNNPKASVNDRFEKYVNDVNAYVTEYRTNMRTIADSTGISADEKNLLQEEYYNKFNEKFLDFNKNAIAENKDNAISLYALQNIYSDLEDEALESAINTIDSTITAGNTFIESMQKGIDARKNTAEGMQFTDFAIPQPDGKVAKLSDYVGKGKYVLVDFWASWCGPCKRAIPHVKSVYDKYHGKNFDVLSVAVWEKTAQESIDTAKAYHVNWNQIVDAKKVPTDIYGIVGIPHIVLFGPDGTIIKRGLYGDAIEEEVAKYVK